jgi:plastocyanin
MKTFTLSKTLLVAFAAFVIAGTTNAAEWGSVKGRILVDGKPPELKPLLVEKEYCMDLMPKPPNETIVLGKDNALVNTIVYLYLPRRGKVNIHPDYEAAFKEPVVLDNKGCQFHPHVTLVRVGQKVIVKNSDPTGHNTNLSLFGQNPIVPANDQVEVKASKEGRFPMPVQCNIHPFMKAHLLSQTHPYMAVSGEDGTFEIKNLPAGKHEIKLWHESPGNLKDVATKAGKADKQGIVKVTIAAGKTLDLGDIKVPASMLKP